jgi:hypothetical protein
MLDLINVFWQIACRRRGPEDVPDSRFLLWVMGGVYALAQVPISGPVYGFSFELILSVALEIGTLAACVGLLLRLANKVERFQQTMIAFLGVSALLSLFAVPFNFIFRNQGQVIGLFSVPLFAFLALIIWSIVANAHIFSRALSRSFPQGLVLAVCYFIFNVQMFQILLPGSG